MSSTKAVEFWKLGKKIVAAGLNYKALLKERNLPIPKEPVIFLKPTSSYILEGQSIEIPKGYVVNEEVELGVLISKKCKKKEARAKGQPWCMGKGFDTACPVSGFLPCEAIPNHENLRIWCRVNGELRQDAHTSDMVFSVGELMSYISMYMTLEPYDLILTGSPSGAGPISPGDVVEGGLGDTTFLKFPVK